MKLGAGVPLGTFHIGGKRRSSAKENEVSQGLSTWRKEAPEVWPLLSPADGDRNPAAEAPL